MRDDLKAALQPIFHDARDNDDCADLDEVLDAVLAVLAMRSKTQERVICAAIYVDTGKDEPERRSYSYPKTGLVFAGWRHADCFVALTAWAQKLTDAERREIEPWHLIGNVQGFLTSTGRFVRRDEAWSIAQAAGQIPDQQPIGSLTSEDLY